MANEEKLKKVFASNLNAFMKANGDTQSKIAAITGMSQQAVSSWLNAKRMPRMGIIEKLAEHFNIQKSDLLEEKDSKNDSPTLPNYPGIELIPPTKKIPMLGAIACGQPIYTNREYTYIDGPIKADFCLRAQGDSMIGARIRDGDLVFCRKQEMVDDGEIAAVVIGDEATLKRLFYYPDKNLVILKAENPDYPDQLYVGPEIDEIEVLGKAIAFQSVI